VGEGARNGLPPADGEGRVFIGTLPKGLRDEQMPRGLPKGTQDGQVTNPLLAQPFHQAGPVPGVRVRYSPSFHSRTTSRSP